MSNADSDADAARAPASNKPGDRPPMHAYAIVALLLAGVGVLVGVVSSGDPVPVPHPEVLIGPIVAMVALTGVVIAMTALVRHYAVARGLASTAYYADYKTRPPADWIERPARTFNNLMQLPILFYVVCILMIVTGRLDQAQVTLAWIFVAARVAHAAVYIAVNWVPYRFGCWTAGTIALAVLWVRFANQTQHMWW